MTKTLEQLLAERSPESIMLINALAHQMQIEIKEICPNCEKPIVLDNQKDTNPFKCNHCHTKLVLVIDEGSYLGLKKPHLKIVEKLD